MDHRIERFGHDANFVLKDHTLMCGVNAAEWKNIPISQHAMARARSQHTTERMCIVKAQHERCCQNLSHPVQQQQKILKQLFPEGGASNLPLSTSVSPEVSAWTMGVCLTLLPYPAASSPLPERADIPRALGPILLSTIRLAFSG